MATKRFNDPIEPMDCNDLDVGPRASLDQFFVSGLSLFPAQAGQLSTPRAVFVETRTMAPGSTKINRLNFLISSSQSEDPIGAVMPPSASRFAAGNHCLGDSMRGVTVRSVFTACVANEWPWRPTSVAVGRRNRTECSPANARIPSRADIIEGLFNAIDPLRTHHQKR